MKIGLFFGSFNPIHHGHLIIAKHMVEETDLDEVWLVVSPKNPEKINAGLLHERHRLHLTQLALEGETKIRASAIEFSLPRPSFTAETLIYLREKYPTHLFSIIVGSDSYNNLPRWKNARFIMGGYRFLVYTRPEYVCKINPDVLETIIVDAPQLDISSSFIRTKIKSKKSIRYLVPDSVYEEIYKQQFYESLNEKA
jgi:nicotinate-nucleotide adenylyltransferase